MSWNRTNSSSIDWSNDIGSINTTIKKIPEHLTFNLQAQVVVSVYGVLFIIAAIGNLTVFITLIRGRHRKSRISLMITHLSIADLMVTFINIPIEIAWRITVQWMAGNVACKFFLCLRAFGLYLSSNILVCVSVDRYFAILHPLRVNDARRRGKVMLALAWVFSLVCALPQSLVFHVSEHPEYKGFMQCVTFGSFRTQAAETAYNLFCVGAMYFIPLIVIVVAYTCILWEIMKKTRETRGEEWENERVRGRMRLRRSDMSNIERARSRTLRMTITIVAAFIWCWTPYVVMTLWYMFDRSSAKQVDIRLQDGFFIMAVSNSCMNPLVYGSYAMNFRRECRTCFCYFFNIQPLQRKATGSAVTRSSAVTGYTPNHIQITHSKNQLYIQRKYLRPVSAEALMIKGGRNETEEFHSDPGGTPGVYMVPS